jgi:hypothetical protein
MAAIEYFEALSCSSVTANLRAEGQSSQQNWIFWQLNLECLAKEDKFKAAPVEMCAERSIVDVD